MKTVLYELKELRTQAEIAAYLHELARQLATGKILLPKASAYPELPVSEPLLLEVKTEEKVKDGEHRFTFEVELKWDAVPLLDSGDTAVESEENLTQAKAEAMLG